VIQRVQISGSTIALLMADGLEVDMKSSDPEAAWEVFEHLNLINLEDDDRFALPPADSRTVGSIRRRFR